MAGQGRPLALSDRYPDATRLAETRKSFETSAEAGRFGTEGSEVQILSPRPKYRRKAQEIGPFCCTDGLVKSGRALGSSRGGPLLKFAPTAGSERRTFEISVIVFASSVAH